MFRFEDAFYDTFKVYYMEREFKFEFEFETYGAKEKERVVLMIAIDDVESDVYFFRDWIHSDFINKNEVFEKAKFEFGSALDWNKNTQLELFHFIEKKVEDYLYLLRLIIVEAIM
ncbi:MAG: hypothetical protein ACRCX8_20080 [Sarcina sp.]